MGYKKIIALDLGKFKTVACVACVMDVATREHAFETIPMSPANGHDLITRPVTPDAPARSERAAMTIEQSSEAHRPPGQSNLKSNTQEKCVWKGGSGDGARQNYA